MGKLNQKVASLQDEITKLEEYASQLRQSEPQSYQQEKDEIEKNLVDLRVGHLECLIEIYKEQNPIKYEAKKESLEAKLEYLKQGGNIKMWSYANWLKLQSVKLVQNAAENTKEPVVQKEATGTESDSVIEAKSDPATETEIKCDQCDFSTKSEHGLKIHTSSKHK